MVRVKLVKIDAEYMLMATDEEKNRIGEIFEAFEINDEYAQKEKYKKQYALNLHKHIWFVPTDWCEVVEGLATIENNSEDETHKTNRTGSILLVEDGSVDIGYIEDDLGIPCIVYRQGANKPEWL
jgi:hypothetical protein